MNRKPPMRREFAPPSAARDMKKALLEFQFSDFEKYRDAWINQDSVEYAEVNRRINQACFLWDENNPELWPMSLVPIEAFKHDKNNDLVRLFPHKVWCLADLAPNSFLYWNEGNNTASATQEAWAEAQSRGPLEVGEGPCHFWTASFTSPSADKSTLRSTYRTSSHADNPEFDIDCAMISLLGIRYYPWFDVPREKTSKSWLYFIDYHGLDDLSQHPNRQEMPRIVSALGHLCITGHYWDYEAPASDPAPEESLTPSWFAVVVDLERPERPVWLVRELRAFRFSKFSGYRPDRKNVKEYDIPESERKYPPSTPHHSAEAGAKDFFHRLAENDTDLIKMFSSVSEWDHAELDAATLKQYLWDEKNRFQKAIPRFRHVLPHRGSNFNAKDKPMIDELPRST
ncbi:hypothetical protein AYO20_09008 [Fonsecaea nubica]|uniref:Uncharacterized protein n=1 Tax=Fonsecaea nubica TaxID=856822 RepID=A0A178CLE4_9EURO|nr:hypothetical protein AYO20_09008 [Fonsecaea nubica]OAL29815.1 hypothetical protein AYO20_09008 [Fonsecaea nubica]